MKYLKFAENLSYVLTVNKVTQQKLADMLGTTQATINRWLKGVNEPDLATLLEICLIFDETPNSLLGYEDISDTAKQRYVKNNVLHKL